MQHFKLLIFALLLCCLGTLYGCNNKKIPLKPNFVIIMADDLGYGDLGCYGNQSIKTPHIDLLAKHGLKFLNFHSNGAVCSPTRAALLTGRYQQRCGIEGVVAVRGESRNTGMDLDQITFADALEDSGYVSGIVGKWHLGYRIEYNPIYQGFDSFHGFVSGNIDYQSHVDGAGIPDWWNNLGKIKESGYTTELITKHALEFIDDNKNRAFCLYVAEEAPHYPFQGPNDKADRFPGYYFPMYGSRKDKKAAYREMIESMDQGIGRIVNQLKKLNLDKRTLIFFCSDNGGLKNFSEMKPLKGSKGQLWEGGIRVPAIAYWPGVINRGVSDELVVSMDIFPTILSLAHIPYNEERIDGMDLSSHFIYQKSLPARDVYWEYRKQKAVIGENWKFIVDDDQKYLFNLKTDPGEKTNLISQNHQLAQDLEARLNNWQSHVGAGIKMKTK